MDNAVRKMFTESNKDVLRREVDWKPQNPKKK
jgi:hypothetical protein